MLYHKSYVDKSSDIWKSMWMQLFFWMKWSEWSGQCKNVEAEDGRVFNILHLDHLSMKGSTLVQLKGCALGGCTPNLWFIPQKLPCHPFSLQISTKTVEPCEKKWVHLGFCQAFATNFHAAGVGTGPSEVAVRRRSSVGLPMLKEMTPAEVEQITGRLAEVKRSCHDFGETPVEADMNIYWQKKGGGACQVWFLLLCKWMWNPAVRIPKND